MGYLNNSDRHGDPIVKDPERFELVKKMWNMMISGNYTVPKVLKVANEEWGFKLPKKGKTGDKPLTRSGLYHLFNNPFYYGLMKRGGMEHWGKHEPMITEEEFSVVQNLLNRNGTTRPKTK